MTLRNLQIFIRVAECGKMNLAAKQLYISQSSVSQAVSEIEKEFDVVLFDRIGKQLYITPLGRELLEHARKVVSYQESVQEWLGQQGKSRKLRVGVTMTVGSTLLCELVTRMKKACPQSEISAFVGNTRLIEEKLLNGELDIGLVEGVITNPVIRSTIEMQDELVLICGRDHRFYGRTGVSVRELENEVLLLRERGSGTRAQLVEKLEENRIHYREALESVSTEAIIQSVAAGYGVSALSARLVGAELASGEIWACPIEELSLVRHFSIVTYKNRIEPEMMKLFIRTVEKVAAEERREGPESRS